MPRRAQPSSNVLARLRAWFGLRQDELALYLAVGPELVRSIEAGRRSLSPGVAAAMLPLARQLPSPISLLDAPLPAALCPCRAESKAAR
ncbi:helix-turn-helix transcriptional regulator [Hymenobacter sp. 15J16-1T3B]|uniref:helix-turn-helix domain-containing protein n=1 Tax=Hymenobacter sp. 15J16-1T3B TaxID=2886941 RepID=UPI001D1043FA|nr:helix-turn-helix transcriptional regulator [Hymenobacter sp. 15J16-1T3B]MCC3156563.1 helix-turn-helix transcriptional regulator [Hymenobacter sp. 15J16-1T3B]